MKMLRILTLVSVVSFAAGTAVNVASASPAPPLHMERVESSTPLIYDRAGEIQAVIQARAEQAARVAAFLAAVAARPARYDHWIAIHNCEQPGDWYADGFTIDGHFQGGLGISTQAWAENDQGLPSSALSSTPDQQMTVANRIYDRFGPGAWGCKAP